MVEIRRPPCGQEDTTASPSTKPGIFILREAADEFT